MSLALKYQMAKKKAKGGMMCGPDCPGCSKCHGGMMKDGGDVDESSEPAPSPNPTPESRPPNLDPDKREEFTKKFKNAFMSEGGAVHMDDRMLNQHGQEERGPDGMNEDNEAPEMHSYAHNVENQNDHEDMVGAIVKKRQMHFSKGGRVANESGPTADFADNQFDDLVLRDDLEQHYTGANSGDELGDAQEDADRRDVVSQIMRSRKKKDRNPRPA